MRNIYKVIPLICLFVYLGCNKDADIVKNYKTENVIIVVIDGPRYIDTWGDPTHQYIPYEHAMANEGVVCTNFFNNGETYTNQGHAAITTGYYAHINNGFPENPQHPSIFQYWLKKSGEDPSKAWVVTSKDKLVALADCKDSLWANEFTPEWNCGATGLGFGTGYRDDADTYEEFESILANKKPRMALLNFKEPDIAGHHNNWVNYVQGIKDTDEYVGRLWNFIQSNPFYKNKTALFITNDHGRHLDGVADGFKGHGDSCEGCRHVNFMALGPDFKKDHIVDTPYELIDITATVAELMCFDMPHCEGRVIWKLFR